MAEETQEQKTDEEPQMIQLSLEQLDEMWATRTKKLIEELGLTKVDTKHAMFPGVEGAGDEKAARKDRMGRFFQAAIMGRYHDDPVIQKALSEGTDSAGGYLVPDDFRLEVISRVNELSQLYPRVFKFATTLDSIKFPNLDTDVSVSWDEAENADFDESDPVLGQTTYSIHRMNAITNMSRELFADSPTNVVGFLTGLFADAVSRERDNVIAVGNGTDRPLGIYSASITNSVAVGGSLTYAKLVDIETKLDLQYRQNAIWVMNKTNLGRIRKLVDTTGRPLYDRALATGGAATVLGYPLIMNEQLPSGFIFLGDPQRYWWADRQQMGVESTTTGGDTFKKHQVAVKIWERCDGKIVLVAAWAKGTGITA